MWVKARSHDSSLIEWAKRIVDFLCARGVEVYVDPVLGHALHQEVVPESEAYKADYAVIVGGDGTLLRTVQKSGGRLPPIIGFTVDSVGFLLPYNVSDYEKVLDAALSRNYSVESVRLGEYRTSSLRGIFLNEVSVWANVGRLVELDVSINGEGVYRVRSDGVIVATPAGSTAHAMSYGAPIVLPLDIPLLHVVFVGSLSPLIRPLAVYNSEVEIQVLTRPATMVVDGQTKLNLEYTSVVQIRPSDSMLSFISVRDLRRKFTERLKYRLLDRGLTRVL